MEGGPIIPPSLPFVIYGMMANVSIGALFLGGLIPGVFMTLLLLALIAITCIPALIAITCIPALTLWLPHAMGLAR